MYTGNNTKNSRMDLQHQSSDYSICFNRRCPLPHNRIFLPEEDSLDHRSVCFKDIFSMDKQIHILELSQPLQKQKEKEEVLLESESLSALIEFSKRSAHIRKGLVQMFEGLKIDLCQYINFCKVAKMKQFDKLTADASKMVNIVTSGVQKLKTQSNLTSIAIEKIQESIHQDLMHPLISDLVLYDFSIFDRQVFQAEAIKIKTLISNITDSLVTEKHMEGHIETVKYSDMMKAKDFLCMDMNKELSKLGTLCQWDESDVIIKSQLDFILKCPLCPFEGRIARDREKQLEDRLKKVSNHLCYNHLPFLGYCYSQRMNLAQRDPITFEEILYLMASQSFTQLVIIDGSNGKCTNLEVNPAKLHVNFTSKAHPNRGESQCRWILVENPEVAAYYTVLLIEEVAVKLKKTLRTVSFKRNFTNLYSKIIEHKYLTNVIIQEKPKIMPSVGFKLFKKTSKINSRLEL